MSEENMTGSKGQALEAWIDVVARRFGGSNSAVSGGVEINVESPEWLERGLPTGCPLLVAADPQPKKQQARWRYRLRIAEQMAARALIVEPISYYAKVQDETRLRQGEEIQVLRCALGLAVVSGPMRLWRMTVYHLHPWDHTHVIEADDDLFSPSSFAITQADPIDLLLLESRLEKICSAIRRIQVEFVERPEVQQILREQKHRLAAEVSCLDSLYFDDRYQRGLLQGLPIGGLDGDIAIENEYRRRLNCVIERHALTIQTKILSIGVIFCKGRRRESEDKVKISLPFTQFDILRSHHQTD
jgi:hypothetical protein